jgi:hypothetical protein
LMMILFISLVYVLCGVLLSKLHFCVSVSFFVMIESIQIKLNRFINLSDFG